MTRRSALLAALAVAAVGLPAEARSYSVSGVCTFAGAPNGSSLQIVLAGHAEAVAQGESRVPLYTEITCKLTNVPDGGTKTMVSKTGVPGAAVVTGDTQGGWTVDHELTVCVSARAIFGPVNPIEIVRPEVCF